MSFSPAEGFMVEMYFGDFVGFRRSRFKAGSGERRGGLHNLVVSQNPSWIRPACL